MKRLNQWKQHEENVASYEYSEHFHFELKGKCEKCGYFILGLVQGLQNRFFLYIYVQ